jgi:hypothetical protein
MSDLSKNDKGKQREPLPSLLLGPPSQNASHVSLPGILVPGHNLVSDTNTLTSPSLTIAPQRSAPTRQRSGRGNNQADTVTGPALSWTGLPRQQHAGEERQSDRTDALWAEMQSTLEEVELSAVNGMHVFRPEHTKALEELRTAQIALAQAWARSEADDAVDTVDKESKISRAPDILGSEGRNAVENTDGTKSTANSTGSKPGSSHGANKTGSKFEETETDILLARKRREANDKYFQRVNEGVLEVVARLEEVAIAMRAVEQGSRNIWGEDSPVPSINS